jgi:hypothetical protein
MIAWIPWVGLAQSVQGPFCEPCAEVRQELEKASWPTVAENATVEQTIGALRSLRERFPDDVFVHLRYQDAINEVGVEGHLEEMFEEYLALTTKHPDDVFYLYLYGRTLEGRMTPQAVSTMEEVLKLDPAFAPAHRTLAEIYGSTRFGDRQKEKAERAKFAEACPGGSIPPQPPPLPQPGDLSRARQLLGQDDAEDRVAEVVYQAMQQDQWRLQRIRPFDWYTAEWKKQVALEAELTQWKGWSLLVRHYGAIHQDLKLQPLLVDMQDRFRRIHGDRNPHLFWTAATELVALYAQANQPDTVRETLKQMERFLLANPDGKRFAQLAKLKLKHAVR